MREERGEERKGPSERPQRSEGDLQESILTVVSGPELGSPGLSSKNFSLAEISHQINYIRKFYIKYTRLEKPTILVPKNLNSYSYNFRNLSLYKRSYKTAFLGNTQLSCSVFIFQIYFKHKIVPHLQTFLKFFILCVSVLSTHVCASGSCKTHGGQKSTAEPLEQELQTAASYHAGARNQTGGLCKSLQESNC